MAKATKPVPFVTIVLEKQNGDAMPPGYQYPGSLFQSGPGGIVFDSPAAFTGVLATLADQYGLGQITLRVTVEGFLRESSNRRA